MESEYDNDVSLFEDEENVLYNEEDKALRDALNDATRSQDVVESDEVTNCDSDFVRNNNKRKNRSNESQSAMPSKRLRVKISMTYQEIGKYLLNKLNFKQRFSKYKIY